MYINNPEAVRELIRRLLWSMNDESGSAGWSAPEAIGEIIYHHPKAFGEFVPVVVNASGEDIFHRGILWTLGRIGQADPLLVIGYIPLLTNFLANPRPEVRGYAAWALGEIGVKAALPTVQGLIDDKEKLEVYQNRELFIKSVDELAKEAIAKIKSKC
nr:DVU0298 family protein [Desulforamulus aquiferis]